MKYGLLPKSSVYANMYAYIHLGTIDLYPSTKKPIIIILTILAELCSHICKTIPQMSVNDVLQTLSIQVIPTCTIGTMLTVSTQGTVIHCLGQFYMFCIIKPMSNLTLDTLLHLVSQSNITIVCTYYIKRREDIIWNPFMTHFDVI